MKTIKRYLSTAIKEDLKDKMDLRFLRDTDRREVDFVVIKNKHINKIDFFMESQRPVT